MYQRLIKAELARTGFIGKYDARHIEAFMRLEYGCLDGLSKSKFAAEVKICRECIDAGGIVSAEDLAKSYGL